MMYVYIYIYIHTVIPKKMEKIHWNSEDSLSYLQMRVTITRFLLKKNVYPLVIQRGVLENTFIYFLVPI